MAEIDVNKIVEGELSQEDIERMDNELTPEQKAEAVQLASAKFKETLGSLSAIRKEKNRVLSKAQEIEQEAHKSADDRIAQFRNEQVQKAKDRFKTEYNLSDEEFVKVEKTFARLDSGAVDSDLVYKDLIGSYAYLNSDSLLKAKTERDHMERNAETANAGEAGSSSVAPVSIKPASKHSDEAVALAKQAGITVEAAERQVKEGTSRRLM